MFNDVHKCRVIRSHDLLRNNSLIQWSDKSLSMSTRHVRVPTTCSCCISACSCCMDILPGHAASPCCFPCCIPMPHDNHVHACLSCISMLPVHAECHASYQCCISMLYEHAVYCSANKVVYNVCRA